jgi:hypothetical protein
LKFGAITLQVNESPARTGVANEQTADRLLIVAPAQSLVLYYSAPGSDHSALRNASHKQF